VLVEHILHFVGFVLNFLGVSFVKRESELSARVFSFSLSEQYRFTKQGV
jgi:hypothetical protein